MPKPTLRLCFLVLILAASISINCARVNADVPDDGEVYAEVDRYIAVEMHELKIPGLEVAIVNKDQVVYTQGYGIADASRRPVTAQTPMILGSLTKGFTALAVLQLVETGKIDLDARVTAYLPWFRLSDQSADIPVNAWQQITVRQLLNQTSGISEYTGVASWNSNYQGDDALEKQVRSFAAFSLARTPGVRFEYSNANYQALGMIVQAVSGESYEAYIAHHLFTPLDMDHSYALALQAKDLATGYRFWFGQPVAASDLPIPRAQGPSAFIASNAEDMSHYLVAILNSGRYGETQVLSAAGMAALQTPAAPMENGSSYAMGWVVDPDGSLSHTGETPGFTSGIRIQGNWGVFVARNIAADQREGRLDEMVPGILNILNGQEPVKNIPDPAFRRIMIGLAFIMVVVIVGILLSVRRLVSWRHQDAGILRSKRRHSIVIPAVLLLYLGLAAGLWYLGPISNHRSITILAMSAPDQMLLLGSDVALALLGAALQLVSLYSIFRPQSR